MQLHLTVDKEMEEIMGKIKNVLQALKKWIFLEDEEEELREVLDYAFDGVDIQFFGAEVDEIIYDEEDDAKVIDFPQSTEITKKAR